MDGARDKRELLRIGTVAQSFGVSENAIRRLEAAGLLKPAVITESSGYRYYDRDNILLLTELFALKSFGFAYEDLRAYLRHPGDYAALYEKLLERKAGIDRMVEEFGRRIPDGRPVQCRIVELRETRCFCETAVLTPGAGDAAGHAKALLYETIRAALPVDFDKPVHLMAPDRDYGTFRWEDAQEMTLCVPLRDGASGAETRLIPGCTALRVSWDPARTAFPAVRAEIDTQLSQSGLRPCGPLRIVCDAGTALRADGQGGLLRSILQPVSPGAAQAETAQTNEEEAK